MSSGEGRNVAEDATRRIDGRKLTNAPRTKRRAVRLSLAWLSLSACNPGAFDSAPRREDATVEKAPKAQAGADAGSARSEAMAGAVAASSGSAMARRQPVPEKTDPLEEDAGPKRTPPPQDKAPPMTEPEPAKPAPCREACTAAHATGSCEAGACHFECNAGYGDCDGDLARASKGSGCETPLAADLAHCGRCDQACSVPTAGYASCANATCMQHALSYAAVTPGLLHGTPNMTRVMQLCPDGMVLSGLDGYVDDDWIADSLRLHCSPLALASSPDGPTVSVGDAVMPLPLNGGLGWEAVAKEHTPYEMQCAPGEVVSEVQVSLWSHWANAQGEPYVTIKDFSLRCAAPHVENGRVVLGDTGPALSTGVSRDVEMGMSASDSCGMNGLIRGFTLGYVTNIDELTTLCGQVRVSAEPRR